MSQTNSRDSIVRAIVSQQLINDETPVLALIDCDGIHATVQKIKTAFPDHFRHYFAVKANSHEGVLREVRKAGMAAEVASPAEFSLALKAGFSAEDMIFDAPVKSRHDIHRALELGVSLNMDNFQEFELVASWMKNNKTQSLIGFRINPQVGGGASEKTSTATQYSKFGIGLHDEGAKEKILCCYEAHPWLQAIHVHVGSIACPLPLMSRGISAAVDLAEAINARVSKQQISTIDIGGGLPVDFTDDKDDPTFTHYASELAQNIPELFSGKYKIITEFGRSVIAKNGLTISRIEYTKTMGGRPIALSQLGVQSLMRLVFEPEHWYRRVSTYDAHGKPKKGKLVAQDIAGPACFSGDLIFKERPLPRLEQGDYILVHDTGAYCSSNHFYYNALPKIPLMGFSRSDDTPVNESFIFSALYTGQSIDDVVNEYSL